MLSPDRGAGQRRAGRRVFDEGFDPNGIPADVSADPVMERPGDRSFVNDDGLVTSSEAGTEGGTTPAPGVNGSRARLPYDLDPAAYAGAGQLAIRRAVAGPAALGLVPAATAGQRSAAAPAWCRRPAVSTTARCEVQWATDDRPPPTSRAAQWGSPTSAPPRRGATCGRRCPRCRPTPPRSGWSPPMTTWHRSTGSRSLRRGSRGCARCRTSSARPIRFCWTGWSVWPSRVSGRSGIKTVSRGTEVADPARPVRRRGQLAGDGQQRRRAAGHHRVAGRARTRCPPI